MTSAVYSTDTYIAETKRQNAKPHVELAKNAQQKYAKKNNSMMKDSIISHVIFPRQPENKDIQDKSSNPHLSGFRKLQQSL